MHDCPRRVGADTARDDVSDPCIGGYAVEKRGARISENDNPVRRPEHDRLVRVSVVRRAGLRDEPIADVQAIAGCGDADDEGHGADYRRLLRP